ncbi:MAG TPA: DNA-processing protein DprA [Alphaproteobacteria bacterium]|jgi:DNA processing protein|nr:DNA-processing protein DprA [Alphaproteobacteria bacterium]
MNRADTVIADAERIAWLRLIRSENVGPVTFRALLGRYGSASAALEELPALARKGGRSQLRIPSPADAEREIQGLAKIGGRLLTLSDSAYPRLLAAIEDAPPVLSVLGRPELLTDRALAIVGARNASGSGRKFGRDLAHALGQLGYVIVSGLARGLDAAAHEGALATGTVAVMAGGVDIIYPRDNAALYERIRESGALVSEQPLGLNPTARHFPIRNRIVSGLSLGVVVVEASLRSGSLITARLAGEQGREVMAVPGSPLDPRARGANRLLRDGAALIEEAADVIAALGSAASVATGKGFSAPPQTPPKPLELELEKARSAVFEQLSPVPLAVDEIIRQCHLSPAVVALVLLELELAGRVERHPGNRIASVIA